MSTFRPLPLSIGSVRVWVGLTLGVALWREGFGTTPMYFANGVDPYFNLMNDR